MLVRVWIGGRERERERKGRRRTREEGIEEGEREREREGGRGRVAQADGKRCPMREETRRRGRQPEFWRCCTPAEGELPRTRGPNPLFWTHTPASSALSLSLSLSLSHHLFLLSSPQPPATVSPRSTAFYLLLPLLPFLPPPASTPTPSPPTPRTPDTAHCPECCVVAFRGTPTFNFV